VKSPKLFTRYATKNLGKGIKARIGFKAKGGSQIQSFLFDKKRWNLRQAQAWVKAHQSDETILHREEFVKWIIQKRGVQK
jgi:hypothetical protein